MLEYVVTRLTLFATRLISMLKAREKPYLARAQLLGPRLYPDETSLSRVSQIVRL